MRVDPFRTSGRPAACMINFNGTAYLPKTLGRLLELRDQFSEIVLVDDGSTDDSLRVAETLGPGVRIIQHDRNKGPGAARNTGAAALDSKRILFVDNDVTLRVGTLPRLEAVLDESPNASMAVPRIVTASDPDHVEYEGGTAHVSGLVSLRLPLPSDTTVSEMAAVPIGSLITCCFLFDRERWGDPPPFDEAFRIYLEDHELGLRTRMLGKDLVAAPDAVCLHGAGTPGVSIRETGRHTSVRVRNTILNRWQVILKLYQTRTLILMAPYLVLFELYQLAGCLALGWGREWWNAARELGRRWSDLRLRRHEFQRLRRRPDHAVLTAGPHPFNPALARRLPVRISQKVLDLVAGANWSLVRGWSGGRIGS